jgi:TRAP-type C4-dicarboxylate transport system permease small subunit
MLLPVAEIFLRAVFKTGISGSSAIVQHLTLIVAMLGGAIAARDGRLLALSSAQTFLKGRAKAIAQITSSAMATAVSGFLCAASMSYVTAMKPLGKVLVYGIPVWTIQLFLPLGFGLIAWRLIWHGSDRWSGRLLTLAMAAALAAIALWSPFTPDRLMVPALVILGITTLLGAPIFTALGGMAMILFWGNDLPIQSVPLKHYSLTTNDLLPSIPIFTLAGYFLAEGGASKRLVRVFQGLVGHFRGGPAIMTALVCAFFTSFTGASGVTILALGGVLMPVLLAARYTERAALGLLTGAGSLGMLFPPCLPLILYAIVANHSAQANLTIKQMFLGGIGPGILLVILTAWWGIRKGPKERSARTTFSWREARAALWDAKWEMLIPVVAIVSLFTVPTTVEAAALTATRHYRLRATGGRCPADPGSSPWFYTLPGRRANTRRHGGVVNGYDQIEVALSARLEPGADSRRGFDRDLRGDRCRRALVGSYRSRLRHRPHSPGDHFSGQYGIRFPGPSGRFESAPGFLSL